MQDNTPYPLKRLLWPLLLGLVCLFYVHGPYGSELFYPRHSWAQSDRLALAMQFHDHGMDLFHPRTYSTASEDRITGVEFPVQSYMAAALGFVFGRENIPSIFRILTSLAVLFGFVMLFRIVDERIRNIGLSLIAPAFLLASPTLQHFTWSYLPDAFGFGLFLGGLYLASRFAQKPSAPTALACVALCSFAALTKMSVAFYLPLLCVWLFFRLRQKQDRLKLLGVSVAAATLLAAWLRYMYYLNKTYGSVTFLAQAMPIGASDGTKESWIAGVETDLQDIFFYHHEHFLLAVGYWALLTCSIFVVAGLFFGEFRKKAPLQLLGITLVGSLAGTLVMGSQLIVHDYYAIVLWGPTIAMLVACAVVSLYFFLDKIQVKPQLQLLMGLLICILLLFNIQRIHLKQTRGEFRQNMQWLLEADPIPDGILGKGSKVIFPSNSSPNLPQTVFDTPGLSKKLELNGADGILKLTGEARTFGFSHVIISMDDIKNMKEVIACGPQWIDTIFYSNTWAMLRFKDTEKYQTWWTESSPGNFEAIFPNDSCANLPYFFDYENKFSERISPSRRIGFGMDIPLSALAGADSMYESIEFLCTQAQGCFYLAQIKHNDRYHTLIQHDLACDNKGNWHTQTMPVAIPDSFPSDASLVSFLVNDSQNDTLIIRSGHATFR